MGESNSFQPPETFIQDILQYPVGPKAQFLLHDVESSCLI